MEELLYKQPFYNKLNDETKKLLKDLSKSYNNKKIFNNISIYIYFIIGIIFLICFKNIIFQKIYISNINTVFSFCKLFIIIGGMISICGLIGKQSSKNLEKSINKLKSFLVMDICSCKTKCSCKNELVKFLSSQGIYLL